MFCFPGSLKENKSPASKHAAVTMFPVGSLETCEVPERHRQVNGSSVDKAHQLNASLLLMTAALYLIKTQKSREFQDLVDHVKPTFFFFFFVGRMFGERSGDEKVKERVAWKDTWLPRPIPVQLTPTTGAGTHARMMFLTWDGIRLKKKVFVSRVLFLM